MFFLFVINALSYILALGILIKYYEGILDYKVNILTFNVEMVLSPVLLVCNDILLNCCSFIECHNVCPNNKLYRKLINAQSHIF